mgnify:CR=1 FL=1
MKKILLSVAFLSCINTYAQDLHFSQTAQTPLLINPAAAGVYDGWERVIINHRNQWLGAGTQFMTTSIAADANFGKSRMNDKAHLGLGIMFYNDIGGDSRFGSQTGSLTVSGILPMGGSGHTLSAGIQGGFGSRNADYTSLRFTSQWNGTEYDPLIGSGEANNASSFRYADASAGIYYVFDGGQSTFSRNNDFKFQLGVAGYHLNKPQLKYATVDGDRLMRKYVIHAGVVADLPAPVRFQHAAQLGSRAAAYLLRAAGRVSHGQPHSAFFRQANGPRAARIPSAGDAGRGWVEVARRARSGQGRNARDGSDRAITGRCHGCNGG